jgi:hypothetical protein
MANDAGIAKDMVNVNATFERERFERGLVFHSACTLVGDMMAERKKNVAGTAEQQWMGLEREQTAVKLGGS